MTRLTAAKQQVYNTRVDAPGPSKTPEVRTSGHGVTAKVRTPEQQAALDSLKSKHAAKQERMAKFRKLQDDPDAPDNKGHWFEDRTDD